MAKLLVPRTDSRTLTRRIDWLKVCLAASIAGLVVQLILPIVNVWRQWPWPGHQVSRSVVLDSSKVPLRVQYAIYLPPTYSKQSRWPLLLYLHGSGHRGEELELVTKSGPPFLVSNGKDLPLVLVSPQCRAETVWHSDELLALLEHVESQFFIDPNRVYVAGYSMGGHGAWNLACTAPDRFAAVVPVAGSGDVDSAERLVGLPIWAFHGADDDVVPVESSRRMAEAVQAQGGHARLTVLEGEAHGICNLVFSRDDLYEWLLQQRR